MGQESANYYFKLKQAFTKESIEEAFKDEPHFSKNKKGNLFYCDFNFWIDIMLVGNERQISSLSIRIALCNPIVGVEYSFKKLLQLLFSKFNSAELFVLSTKVTVYHFDETAWNTIWDSYKGDQRIFLSRYGHLELPVSSDLFFKYIDEKEA